MSEGCKHESIWRAVKRHSAERWYCTDCETIIDITTSHEDMAAQLTVNRLHVEVALRRIEALEAALQSIEAKADAALVARLDDTRFGTCMEIRNIARAALSPTTPESTEL